MQTIQHKSILKRVRREAAKREYVLGKFAAVGIDNKEYSAIDRMNGHKFVLVVAELSRDESQKNGSMKINAHTMYFWDSDGWQYIAMFMSNKKEG